MIAGIDVPHHEGRELVFLLGGAAVEEHDAPGLEQTRKFLQHALVVRQMLDHAHDDDGVERLARLVVVEVGEQDVEAVAEIGELRPEIRLRHLGVGDAGEAHAGLQSMAGEGAPAGADLEHASCRAQARISRWPSRISARAPWPTARRHSRRRPGYRPERWDRESSRTAWGRRCNARRSPACWCRPARTGAARRTARPRPADDGRRSGRAAANGFSMSPSISMSPCR